MELAVLIPTAPFQDRFQNRLNWGWQFGVTLVYRVQKHRNTTNSYLSEYQLHVVCYDT